MQGYKNWFPATTNASTMVETMSKSSVRHVHQMDLEINPCFFNSPSELTFWITYVYCDVFRVSINEWCTFNLLYQVKYYSYRVVTWAIKRQTLKVSYILNMLNVSSIRDPENVDFDWKWPPPAVQPFHSHENGHWISSYKYIPGF
jgi:hypothetical protein